MSTTSFVQAVGADVLLDLDSLPHTYGYDGSGNLITDTVTRVAGANTHTYTKTYAYSGTQLLSETGWVKSS